MKIIKTIALAGLIAISMTSCCNNKADAVLENIFERRSVRKFTSEPVSDKQIEKLLRAAMAARSALAFRGDKGQENPGGNGT